MTTLTLNDSTTYNLDWCNADKGIFNINLETDQTFLELAVKFGDHQLTSRITAQYGEAKQDVYEGYTELRSIQFDMWRTGTVLITLLLPERTMAVA